MTETAENGGTTGDKSHIPSTHCTTGVVIELNEHLATAAGRELLRRDPFETGYIAILNPVGNERKRPRPNPRTTEELLAEESKQRDATSDVAVSKSIVCNGWMEYVTYRRSSLRSPLSLSFLDPSCRWFQNRNLQCTAPLPDE